MSGWRRLAPVLAVALLALIALGLLWRAVVLDAELERREVRIVAERLAAAFRTELARTEAVLRVLALSPQAVAQDWRSLHAEARSAAPLVLGNNVVVYDTQGVQHMNTLRPADAELPKRAATPARLLAVFQRPEGVLSDLFVGPVTGTRLAAFGVPVGGVPTPAFGIGVGISPDQIARLFDASLLPEGWIAAALDREGVIAARTREAARMVGTPAVTPLREAAAAASEGTLEATTQEGLDVVVAWRRDDRQGWTIAVAAPRGPGVARRGWQILIGGVAIVATAAVALQAVRRAAGAA